MRLEEGLNMFFESPVEPPYSKIFSPIHSQMQSELGSSGMYLPMPNDNEPDFNMAEFLDSILCNPDENLRNMASVKDNGSYSELDAEGINACVSGTFQDTIS